MSKYSEFQEKRAAIKKEQGIASDFYMVEVAQKYYLLLEEVLEEFKKIEDNLEWRKKVEAKEWGDEDTTYSIELTNKQRQKILKETKEK